MKRTLLVMAMAVALALSTVAAAFAVTAVMGNDATSRAALDGARNITIIDNTNNAPFDGTFDTIEYYPQATGTISFVIVNADNIVTWISDSISISSSEVDTVQTLSLDTPAGVTAGSKLAVYTVGTGVIPFDYDADVADAEWKGGEPSLGQDLTPLANSSQVGQDGRSYSMNTTIDAASPDICKNGGWEFYDYKNQGQCIASIVANENAGK